MENETEAITVPQPTIAVALSKPTTERAIVMAQALKEDQEQRAILSRYVESMMKENIDYGIIPGTQKPTLLKPGAEKLTDLFRCTPSYDLMEKIEDWEHGLFHYQFRVKIASRDSGTVLAEGFGSANSKEGRYRWRDSSRKCPNCGKEAIIKGKKEYGGGWICFAKKGGCGSKWSDGAPEIEGQEQGRIENDDIYTLVNTILKIAKKRALVDGAIALARCSDIFTQDIEDFSDTDEPRREASRASAQKASTKPATKAVREEQTASMRAQALWSEACERIGKTKTLERWNLALGDLPKDKSKWSNADFVKLSSALFPEEADALGGSGSPPDREPGADDGDDTTTEG